MAVKCDQLTYTPISPLTFRISGGTKVLIPHKNSDGVIHSLEGPKDLNLTLGLTLKVKRLKYKINIIEEKWIKNVLVYDLSIAKHTKSSIFLVPMFGGNRSLYMWSQLFMNCFLYEEDNVPHIQLLYRFSGDPLFLKFEKALKKFDNYVRKEDPNSNFVLFTFTIPARQKSNYNKFIKGQYSKFSKLYKMNLLEFHNYGTDSLIGQVIFKAKARKRSLEKLLGCPLDKDSELLSIINIKNEVFNPEIYF